MQGKEKCTMYLDVNSGVIGEGIILFTASHELVHMIREGSPEHFKALADFLVENYVDKGVDIHALTLKRMTDQTKLTYDEAFEEVIARACEDFLRDTHINEKAKALYKENRTLWEKIKDALGRIIDDLKAMMKKGGLYAKGSSSYESRLTAQMGLDIVERAQELWIEGVQASAENLRNMEKPVDEGGTKYSIRRTQKMTWKEQIESYYNNNGNIRHSDTLVLENALPDFLNSIVSNNLPVALPLRVINKAQHGKNSSHLVSNGNIKKLNSAIRSPLAIIYDPSRNSLFL